MMTGSQKEENAVSGHFWRDLQLYLLKIEIM